MLLLQSPVFPILISGAGRFTRPDIPKINHMVSGSEMSSCHSTAQSAVLTLNLLEHRSSTGGPRPLGGPRSTLAGKYLLT